MHTKVDYNRFIVLEGPCGPFWSTLRAGRSPHEAQFVDDGTQAYSVIWFGDDEEECKRQYRKARGLPEDFKL